MNVTLWGTQLLHLSQLVCRDRTVPSTPDSESLEDTPDDGHELTHSELLRHEELRLIQRRQVLLSLISLDNHLKHTPINASIRWEVDRTQNRALLTGILVGNLVRIPDTSCFLVADRWSILHKKSKDNVNISQHVIREPSVWYKDTYTNSSSVWKVWEDEFSPAEACCVPNLTCARTNYSRSALARDLNTALAVTSRVLRHDIITVQSTVSNTQ